MMTTLEEHDMRENATENATTPSLPLSQEIEGEGEGKGNRVEGKGYLSQGD